MLPGGSWTDFGTPENFSKFYKSGREKPLPEAPGDLLEGPWTCSRRPKKSSFFHIRNPRETLKLDPMITPRWSLDPPKIDEKLTRNGHLPLG